MNDHHGIPCFVEIAKMAPETNFEGSCEPALVPTIHGGCTQKMALIGPAVSEKMF